MKTTDIIASTVKTLVARREKISLLQLAVLYETSTLGHTSYRELYLAIDNVWEWSIRRAVQELAKQEYLSLQVLYNPHRNPIIRCTPKGYALINNISRAVKKKSGRE